MALEDHEFSTPRIGLRAETEELRKALFVTGVPFTVEICPQLTPIRVGLGATKNLWRLAKVEL